MHLTKHHINRVNFTRTLLTCTFLTLISLNTWELLFPNFINRSDNAHYSVAFEELEFSSLVDSFEVFKLYTSGSEPISPLFFYAFANFLTYNQFIVLLNFIFLFVCFKYLSALKINSRFSLILVTTNFYLLTVCLSAHRLKISLIFILISLLTKQKVTKKICLLLSLLSHLQSLAIIMPLTLTIDIKQLEWVKKLRVPVAILSSLSVFLIINYTNIEGKFLYYTQNGSLHFKEFLIALILVLSSYHLTKRKFNNDLICGISVSFFILLLSGMRLNLYIYLIATNMILKSNLQACKSLYIFLSSSYLALKIVNLYFEQYSFSYQ